MADNIANKDEAMRCLGIAKRALEEGDLTKAEKFCTKAQRLYTGSEVTMLALQIEQMLTQAAGQNGRTHSQNAESSSASPRHRQQNGSSAGTSARRTATEQGPIPGPGLRQRPGHAARPAATEEPDLGTPEQKELVQQILKAKTDYYAVLGLPKTATDEDIKKAYKKLALKLHPDKCKAKGGEEAFKMVSKAFSCLSDTEKRAYYDRTGYESSQAAAAAQTRTRSSHHHNGGAQFYGAEDIDPEEIFNMFFGGAFGPGMQSRMYRAQFGHGGAQRQRQQQHNQQHADPSRHMLLGMLQMLPVLLLVLFTFFGSTQQPVYTLSRDSKFSTELHTQRLEVPFFVPAKTDFDRSYPMGSSARFRLERQIEGDYYDRIHAKCQDEKMMQHRAYSWGKREQAKAMKLPSCDELGEIHKKLGTKKSHGYYS